MPKRSAPTAGSADLRRRAEIRLANRQGAAPAPLPEAEVRRLVHELQVHQIELELQNEELQAARHEVESMLVRYTELFDFAPIGYAVIAPDETIQEINHVGAHLLGRERAALMATSFATFMVAHHRATFSAILRGALIGELKQVAEVEIVGQGGRDHDIALTATALRGAEPAILVAFEEITERKAREAKLEMTEAALREASRRKDEFLAVLSHELRNPLTPIRNSVFLLTHEHTTPEQATKVREIVDRQVDHLSRLVDDLLDVSRISRGKIQLRLGRVDLGKLAQSALDDHRSAFERAGISLEGRLDGGPYRVRGDRARLVQALANLLGNAEKFTPAGGRVVVSLRRVGANVELKVSDTGAGIEPELLEHIFEPFTQAPQTIDRARGGLGLGLATVKGLVELHGGTVGVTSNGPGRGTEGWISLPADAGAGAETSAPIQELVAPPGRRVLIIDDNPDSANTLRDVLVLGGHEVRVAFEGRAGLETAREFHPEIVICDIGLPDIDGYAVARAFRADPELMSAHLVALSGYARDEDRQRATDSGFDRHLTKPPLMRDLDALLVQRAERPAPTS